MKNILSLSDVENLSLPQRNRDAWTVIIAAGGSGRRLQSSDPKPLHQVFGAPMIQWVVDAFRPHMDRFIVITSPINDAGVREFVQKKYPDLSPQFRIQTDSDGTAGAIECGIPRVGTENVAVVWCDQVTVNSRTIEVALRLHENCPSAKLTLPTALRKSPYVYLQRDAQNKLVGVAQRREGAPAVDIGESDCGVFFFNTSALARLFTPRDAWQALIGAKTQELNLLSLLPLLDTHPGSALTLRMENADETLGVNTPMDVLEAEKILRSRAWKTQKAKMQK